MTTSGRNGRQLEKPAKTTFSAIVEAAQHGERTIVTKHGLPAAMIVPMRGDSAFYRPSFAELLLSIPNLNVEGDQSPMPEIDTNVVSIRAWQKWTSEAGASFLSMVPAKYGFSLLVRNLGCRERCRD